MACVLMGCGEYNKVMKSSDLEYKYAYAKKAFENKRYAQAYTILTDLVPVFRGSAKAEESLYLLALSYYENKDYVMSGSYFKQYYQRYPRGQYAELARFYAGYGFYLDSPEAQLDQSETTAQKVKEGQELLRLRGLPGVQLYDVERPDGRGLSRLRKVAVQQGRKVGQARV